jgi:hypothetical protein
MPPSDCKGMASLSTALARWALVHLQKLEIGSPSDELKAIFNQRSVRASCEGCCHNDRVQAAYMYSRLCVRLPNYVMTERIVCHAVVGMLHQRDARVEFHPRWSCSCGDSPTLV